MHRKVRTDYWFQVFLLGAALFISLAISGTVRSYSPVPFWDMWDSYLNFYLRINSGGWSQWWAQHNEHRIVLARILFWADLTWFNGAGWFLLMTNYFFLALVCLIFWFAVKESCPKPYWFFGLFVVIWLSLWSQSENLTWAFQGQFILAQLLPLSAFFMLHRAVVDGKDRYSRFYIACFLGLLSIGSLANGVLALPLMSTYAVAVRLSWERVSTLVILSCFGVALYFYNYHAPAHHGSLQVALRDNPIFLLQYLLLYLGGPFFYFSIGFSHSLSYLIAETAGGILLASFTYLLWKSLQSRSRSSFQLALLAFILYIVGTAFGTAGGRLIFGVEKALASRYQTPALMAWAALFILFAPSLANLGGLHRWKVAVPLLAMVFILLPLQLRAMKPENDLVFKKNIAALALEMGVNDRKQIRVVYPNAEVALAISQSAVVKDLSVFGLFPFKDVRKKIKDILATPDRVCEGHVDQIESIDDKNYLRVTGWFFDQDRKMVPKALWIVGSDGKVDGYALLGEPRPDVIAAIDPTAVNAGFKGYILSNTQGSTVSIVDLEANCKISTKLPLSE